MFFFFFNETKNHKKDVFFILFFLSFLILLFIILQENSEHRKWWGRWSGNCFWVITYILLWNIIIEGLSAANPSIICIRNAKTIQKQTRSCPHDTQSLLISFRVGDSSWVSFFLGGGLRVGASVWVTSSHLKGVEQASKLWCGAHEQQHL